MRKRSLVALAVLALALVLSSISGDVTGVNPLTSKRDDSGPAYWDTTFATAAGPSDVYMNWGFSATKVWIHTMTASQSVLAQVYGNQNPIRNYGGSASSTPNPRTGIARVDGEELTIPALTDFPFDGDGAALFYGARVKYTGGACTVIVSAVRGTR